MDGAQMNGWFVMLLGMGTVFVGLICLIYITKLMSLVCKSGKGAKAEAAAAPAPQAAPPVASAAPAAIPNRAQFVAAKSAAIAMEMGTEPQGLRIHSIRPAGSPQSDRGQFVAAVSAAIATQMGTDVSGLRIHSIQPR